MIVRYSAMLAPILLWCGTPAHAADIATIDCVGKLLGPATMDSISNDFQASIEGARNGMAGLPPKKGSASDPSVRAEVVKAARLCGEAHGWTIAARAAAGEYAMAELALPLFEAAVRDDGIDPGQITRLSKQLPSTGSGWEKESLSEPEKRLRVVAAVNLRLLRAGIFLQTPQQRRDVGALALWLVVLDNAQTDFIAG
ncbi:MAG: hypothetical protein ABIO86_01680 [Sphingomonas sp.]